MKTKIFYAVLATAILMASEAIGQDLPELIKAYEKYCNETVLDTVTQHGTITERYKLVDKIQGHYAIVLDTTWQEVDCPEYKFDNSIIWLADTAPAWKVYNSTTGQMECTNSGEIKGSEKAEDRTRSVTRDYVCECKRQPIDHFSEYFWNFVKNGM